MKYFLVKTEPGTYSIDNLSMDKETDWNGVKNPQATAFIKSMRKGDSVFIYHSGGESMIVGLAEVKGEPEPEKAGAKEFQVKLKFLEKLKRPVSLAEIKKSGQFGDFRLVYQSRLSVMDVPENFVKWLFQLQR